MALPGECLNVTNAVCLQCGTDLPVKVCQSAAGFYVGFFCPHCGPYSRESGYFFVREAADQALTSGNYGR